MDGGEDWRDKKVISVVMPYFNRLKHLQVTLKTFEQSANKDFEIIIVDDGSDTSQRACLATNDSMLNLKVFEIEAKDKWWANPCHVMNLGFQKSKGDVIVMQSPECAHFGDVLSHVAQHVNSKNYVVYACKSGGADLNKRLWAILDSVRFVQLYDEIVRPEMKRNKGWYQHPLYNPRGYHFLAALTRKNLFEVLNGFDERYAQGHAFDDNEFLERAKRSPLQIDFLSHEPCCCVHQHHVPIYLGKSMGDIWKRNYNLFHMVTKKEKGWKAQKGVVDLNNGG
ncbi:MAG: glycosyltransferase family 2 protein [Candidatus Thorarchaeota archaeon]